MEYSVIVVASGNGNRMNLGYNKMFYRFKDGETVLDKTINHFLNHKECSEIIIVTQSENFDACPKSSKKKIITCVGGKERQDSVMNGLKLVTNEYVFVHDGARPFIDLEVLDRLVAGLKENDACLLAVPCVDTIKVVEEGVVTNTPKRSTLYQAQTPQAFKTELLRNSYKKLIEANAIVTDDSQCVETFSNEKVHIVLGDYKNKKITTIGDIKE